MNKQQRGDNSLEETYILTEEQAIRRPTDTSMGTSPNGEDIPTPALPRPDEERDEAEGGWGFQIIDLAEEAETADEDEDEEDEDEDIEEDDDLDEDDFDDELDDELSEEDDEVEDEEDEGAERAAELDAEFEEALAEDEIDEELDDDELEDEELEDDDFEDDRTTDPAYHAVSPILTSGDVDADWKRAEVTGEETPGGTVSTPDQDVVDEIGQATGVVYQDEEPLDFAEKIGQRDRNRWELDPASVDPDSRELSAETTPPLDRRETEADRTRS